MGGEGKESGRRRRGERRDGRWSIVQEGEWRRRGEGGWNEERG